MRLFERIPLILGFAFMLTGCFWFDENNRTFIADKYYTDTSSDTQTVLYFDDSTTPLMPNVSAIGVTSTYLAVRDEAHYYLFVRSATIAASARETAIGPVDSRTFRLKLQQLSGDSTLQLSAKF